MSSEILLKTIRNAITIDRAMFTFSSGLRIGQTVHLSDPDAARLLRVKGFSKPELGGRWTDGANASIDLKLAPESVGISRLRVQMMPFVTQTEGQTLRLCCGNGEERVVHFSPGASAWTTVDLPLGDVQADALARIQIKVGRTFVPSKLGLSSDSRALGVAIRQIELRAHAVAERVEEQVGEQIGEQIRESPTLSSPAAAKLVALAIGSSIPLASQDAERMIRLTGFSGREPDGRWTDGSAAKVAIRLGNDTGKGRLRLHFTPFVTPRTGQSIRLRCGDGPELARDYAPGPRCETMLDIPLSRVPGDGEISILLKIDTANSPAAVGLGADERRLGIQLHRLELVAGFSRFRSTARWAPRSLLNAVHRIVWTLREFSAVR